MSKVKIIPLGGMREPGKYLFVVEVNESIFVLDCGLVYPEEELLGIDVVIPDFTYLIENKERVEGIFLTHGHADAVGGLSYLLEELEAPVFGTELTIELASLTARSQGLSQRIENFHVIDALTEIEFEDAVVSFFKTTHSIPDSVGVVITTDIGSVVYTGDFKFDPSVSAEYATDFGRLTDIGEKGVIALLSDSSQADSIQENVSDQRIQYEITETFLNAQGRVIVACVGSNIARIQQVLEAAHRSKRIVCFSGDELYEIIDVAIKLDKIRIPSKKIIGDIDRLDQYDDDQVVIIETGNAGEPLQSLQTMAVGKHPQIQLKSDDLVYIATTPSAAMETLLAQTKDAVYRAGAEVKEVTDNVKTSGHATPNDLKMMLSFMKPENFIPIGADYRLLAAHADLAREVGLQPNHIHIPELGDVLEYYKTYFNTVSQVPAGDVLVHGSGVGDIGTVVLRDRRILSEDGIFIVVATISRRLGRVLVGPQITSRGFVYMKASSDLIAACSDMTLDILEKHLDSKNFDWNDLKSDLREQIGKFLFKETKRRPVILPIIMEASGYRLPNEKK